MLKLSIILPIYNVEHFLPDCFDSLYAQDLSEQEYEILCVIDGSPDNSQAVVEQYMSKHTNIRMIVQNNQGVCATRNVGLQNAQGKYVWFVDPDDMIVSNCLKKIYQALEQNQMDVFEMNYKTCEEGYKFIRNVMEFTIDGNSKDDSSGSGCLYVCRREYLLNNHIVFNEKLSYGEDYLWAFQVKYRKHKSIYTNAPLYIYRQRKNSAMNTTNPEKIKKHMEDMIELYKLYDIEWTRCFEDNMEEHILQNIRRRQQLCIEAVLMCLLKMRLPKRDVRKKLHKLQEMGIYPYKFMFWNLVGKETVNPFKVRAITFLFPVRSYYLLLCSLYRLIQR